MQQPTRGTAPASGAAAHEWVWGAQAVERAYGRGRKAARGAAAYAPVLRPCPAGRGRSQQLGTFARSGGSTRSCARACACRAAGPQSRRAAACSAVAAAVTETPSPGRPKHLHHQAASPPPAPFSQSPRAARGRHRRAIREATDMATRVRVRRPRVYHTFTCVFVVCLACCHPRVRPSHHPLASSRARRRQIRRTSRESSRGGAASSICPISDLALCFAPATYQRGKALKSADRQRS